MLQNVPLLSVRTGPQEPPGKMLKIENLSLFDEMSGMTPIILKLAHQTILLSRD